MFGEEDIEALKKKLDDLPDGYKAGLMAPALIYIGRALDEFGQQEAAIKVAEAAVILISNMEATSPSDQEDQQKTINGLNQVIESMRRQSKISNTKREH